MIAAPHRTRVLSKTELILLLSLCVIGRACNIKFSSECAAAGLLQMDIYNVAVFYLELLISISQRPRPANMLT